MQQHASEKGSLKVLEGALQQVSRRVLRMGSCCGIWQEGGGSGKGSQKGFSEGRLQKVMEGRNTLRLYFSVVILRWLHKVD